LTEEIDLKKTIQILARYLNLALKRKVIILFLASLITLAAFLYISQKKYVPAYEGSMVFEIGKLYSSDGRLSDIEHAASLSILLEEKFNVKSQRLRSSPNIVKITAKNITKIDTMAYLNRVYDFVINRHHEMSSFNDKNINTKVVTDASVGDNPINFPRKIIFIYTFIFSIIIISFLFSMPEIFNDLKKLVKKTS